MFSYRGPAHNILKPGEKIQIESYLSLINTWHNPARNFPMQAQSKWMGAVQEYQYAFIAQKLLPAGPNPFSGGFWVKVHKETELDLLLSNHA